MKILGNQEIVGILSVGRRVNEGFKSTTLTADIELTKTSEKFWRVSTGLDSASITLPDATTLPNGFEILFLSSSNGIMVKDKSGADIQLLDPGTIYYFYLISNSTVAGEWSINVDTSFDISVGRSDVPSKGIRLYFKTLYEYDGNVH